jgi:hypothetical protein
MDMIDDAIAVDITHLLRKGFLTVGEATPQTTLNGIAPNGERYSFCFSADARGPRPHVRLLFVNCRGQVIDQRIDITLTRPHLGGACPWFVLNGRRTRKIYMPKGGEKFVTRHGLEYRCRHLGRRKRTKLRSDKFFLKWGGIEVVRPHGMWPHTWEGKLAQLAAIKRREQEAQRGQSKRP